MHPLQISIIFSPFPLLLFFLLHVFLFLIVCLVDGELALIFEYMETDLWRLISGPSPNLPLLQIKCIMKQLFEGLLQCHSAGIMHRDIKRMHFFLVSFNAPSKLHLEK